MASDSRRVAPDAGRPRGADRRRLGMALAAGGAVLLFLGWWGVSGAATIAEQMPYIASGSIPGAALVFAGALLLAGEATRRTDDLIAQLHALLVEEVPDTQAPAVAVPSGDGIVALASGEHYHRSDCALVAGKSGVQSVAADAIGQRKLAACQVCEPESPAA